MSIIQPSKISELPQTAADQMPLMLEAGIILCMWIANGRRHYIVTPSLIGWMHTQNYPCRSLGLSQLWLLEVFDDNTNDSICLERYLILTHWSWVTCISIFTIIGSDNGLLPGQHQAIIWANAGILLIGSLGTNFSEIIKKFMHFHSRNCILKRLENGCYLVQASIV